MAEPAATHENAPLVEQWKCTACAEVWELVERAGVDNGCPECRGPLRLAFSPLWQREHPARTLVALSDDQRWLVVYRPEASSPWTILQRLDEIDGYAATGERYDDIGQSATEVLAIFLATSRAPRLFRLEHTAAD